MKKGDLMTTREAAEILGCCKRTIYRMVHQGDMKVFKYLDRILIHPADLLECRDRLRLFSPPELREMAANAKPPHEYGA